MKQLSYRLVPAIGHKATFGLVVLQSDETVEHELSIILRASGTALYVTRIPSSAEVTSETLAAMEQSLPASASLLPPSLTFDVVGYCCTSGATIIGPEKVEALIRTSVDVTHVTNPISAVLAAFDVLHIKRLAFVTPYVMEVSSVMRRKIEEHGVCIAGAGSFMEAEEAKVARIDRQSIIDAAVETASIAPCDGVFLSCTNLRTMDVIDEIEAQTNLPVVSSNQALAWHILQLSGVVGNAGRFGRLFDQIVG